MIGNVGELPLTLSGSPRIAIAGANADDFTVTTLPPANINANSLNSFQISFEPGGIGTRTATVTIANNDQDEGTFTFAIQGEGNP